MIHFDDEKSKAAIKAFTLSRDDIEMTAAALRYDIGLALKNDERTSLNLLPSHVGLPSGNEQGDFLALDFGGSNLRAARVRLANGKATVVSKKDKPLGNLTGASTTASELFDFIAALVDDAAGHDHTTPMMLGHTFSFPSKPTDDGDAILQYWTKEFAVKGVEGQKVNALLASSLEKIGASNIKPVAIINDTVATLLASAYTVGDTFMSSIYSTGFNVSYLERFGGKERADILDMNAGGFTKVITNYYDQHLEDETDRADEQKLEKMVSGRYIGELMRLALADITRRDDLPNMTSSDVAAIYDGNDAGKKILTDILGDDTDEASQDAAMHLAEAVLRRSAALAAAIFCGTLWHQDANIPQHIAVDGSLYKKVPLIQNTVHDTMTELLKDEPLNMRPDIVTIDDASLIGAAIAAAMKK
ncbi:MAG: hexokinase [Selenomonadaceae bacterium]